MKRILAVLTAIALIFTLPMAAFAQENRQAAAKQLEGYLNAAFASVETPMGTEELTFSVSANDYDFVPYDYRVTADWMGVSPFDIARSLSYSDAEKQKTIDILANVQKMAALAAQQYLPGMKLEGGYHSYYYKYESIHEGYRSTDFLSWANYSGTDPFASDYDKTFVTSFHWTPETDDYDFTAGLSDSLEGLSLPVLNPNGGTAQPLPAPGEGASPSAPTQNGSAVSDTNSDLTVERDYQFRITSLDGHRPVMTADNANFTVSLASQSGNNYFYKIHANGAPGSSSVLYLDGQKLLTATVGGTAAPGNVVSDTTSPFTVKQGGTYQFRLTAGSKPSFAAGSPCFTVSYTANHGNYYYFKVHAVGQPGESSGFYINGAPSPVTVATIC